jgi:hypothetical protein
MNDGGFLYVIGQDWCSPIKIGVASNVPKRLDRLQCANPAPLRILWQSDRLEDPFGVETAIHGFYDAHRLRGEWFRVPGIMPEDFARAVAEVVVAVRVSRHRPQELSASACAAVVAFLLDRERREKGSTTEAGIGHIAEITGLGRSTIWSLRYRQPPDIYVSAYAAIVGTLWSTKGLPPFDLSNLPTPPEVLEVLDGKPAWPRKAPSLLSLAELEELTERLSAAREAND